MSKKNSNTKYYIHPEGWKFAIIFFVISYLISFLYMPASLLGYTLTMFTLWFFRNPKRKTPNIANSIISSADGKVCLIDKACPPEEIGMNANEMLRICVFMNVFNVHINRSPIAGKINKIVYKKGHFFNASLDKASEYLVSLKHLNDNDRITYELFNRFGQFEVDRIEKVCSCEG